MGLGEGEEGNMGCGSFVRLGVGVAAVGVPFPVGGLLLFSTSAGSYLLGCDFL